jgi:hypothetical protein
MKRDSDRLGAEMRALIELQRWTGMRISDALMVPRVYVGDIAYNAVQGTTACYSGFNVFEPIASDSVAGTHIFAAGNFAWANKDGSPCSSGQTTDGEGFNFDTWDMSQSSGTPYTQQGYVTNNISLLNGGYGIEMENNRAGGSSYAHLYIEGNTQFGNRRDTNQTYGRSSRRDS